ncbi:hypothetical protein [Cellulomonas denverensis]|uniref:Uncharacterized protein n=1 Tax=Cellulomonas denverensis TaxID=264297 RepID=A0A7X6QZI2_9CELL|nr:hypothetical protein [Cellulomonas denverensis]NKY23137.1 hypothetical protein [Cellulomonas denverensis]GIG23781.1 hypothetical protein Cde04nite_00250 [Cellulomonas denverensis]
MQASNRAVTSAVLATLVAVAGVVGDLSVAGHSGPVLAGLLVLLGVVFALGWPEVAGLPARLHSTVVIALGGAAAVLAVWLSREQAMLNQVPAVFAGVVLAAFIAELVRRDGRERLVESVAGTIAGALVPVCSVGWLAAERTVAGDAVVVAGAVALAVGSAVSAFPLCGWLRVGAVIVGATAAGAVVGVSLSEIGLLSGVLLGLAVGILVAAATELFGLLDDDSRAWSRGAVWSVAALPVAVTGILVYLAGRVLIG